MFIGHFAVGLALKRASPATSLGVLTAAVQWLDLLWPFLLLLGLEHVRIDPGNTAVTPLAFDSYPYSHSLLMSAVWGVAFAVAFARGGRAALGPWLAAAVVSHWVLDWATHRPDMPLLPFGGPRLGLGLWNSVRATVAVEGLMFAAGIWLYTTATVARDAIGRWGLVAYVGTLAAIYVGNLAGPPPPDPHTLALVALGVWAFPLWAWRVDAHRTPRRTG